MDAMIAPETIMLDWVRYEQPAMRGAMRGRHVVHDAPPEDREAP